MEAELVQRVGLSFFGIPAAGVHGVGLGKAVQNGWQLLRGMVASWEQLGRQPLAAILTTGGYVGAPVVLAAWLRRIPVLVYLPDIEPGQSIKLTARLARRVGVTVAESEQFLPSEKVVVTGYPLRKEVMQWDRARARRTMSLPETGPVLLVFGGSRGARSINRALLANLAELLTLTDVIHITGKLDWEEVSSAAEALPAESRGRYHPFAYLHSEEMGAALAAADLVVSRAGASVLGEFPYFGLPSILVPYPYAWRYQKVNGEWLAERNAAVVVTDAALNTELVPTVKSLLSDTEQLTAMADAARALASPDAADRLAVQLLDLAGVN